MYDSLPWLYTRNRNFMLRLLPQTDLWSQIYSQKHTFPDALGFMCTQTLTFQWFPNFICPSAHLTSLFEYLISVTILILCPDLLFLNYHHLLSGALPSIWLFKRGTQESALISHLISFPTSTPAAVEKAYQTRKINFLYYCEYIPQKSLPLSIA